MRKVLITLSGKAYDPTTKLIVERGPQWGADAVCIFDDKWLIESGYVKTNQWLYDATSYIGEDPTPIKHGFGWCSWKPFLILTAWDRLQDGDCVLYLDADCYPIAPFGGLFDICAKEGVVLFEEKASNLRYTKGDCFLVMGVPREESKMACGRFSMWKKGHFLARQMLAEWWAYSINPYCTLWGKSTLAPDQPEYYRSSTEQSVLSNLARKYKLPLHRGPDTWGEPSPEDQRDVERYPVSVFKQEWCAGDRRDLSGSSYRNV